MAITVEATANAAISASRSPSVTFSSYDPQVNDVIVMFPSSTGITVTLAAVSGWVNPLGSTTDVETDSHEMCAIYHQVTSGEDSANTLTYTATNLFSVAQTGNVCALVLRGVDPTSPLDAFGSTFNSGNTITPHVLASLLAADITNNDCMVVSCVTKDATGTYTTPTGWTQRTTSNTNQGKWLGTRDNLTTAGAAVASTNITPSAGDEYASITLAFNPYITPPPSGPVTEPPWLNRNSGVSRTNAASETINFGFTAAVGSKLVFIIGGAVTHAVLAGGWVERFSPVNSAELALFEADATSSPDNRSSITVDHNGSNYPCPWECIEFPAGTVYTTGTSANGSGSVTFPNLPGLPGTEQVVIAAFGVGHTSSAGAASATCSSPWVEDVDSDTPLGGSPSADGHWLYTMHAINITASNITPTFSETGYSGSGNFASDNQRVVVAYAVPVISLAPKFESVGAALTGGQSTTANIAVPSGVANKDVIVIPLYVEGPNTVTTIPSGFVEAPDSPVSITGTGQDHSLHIYAKRASGADSGTYNFVISGTPTTVWRTGVALRYSGVIETGTNFWDVTNFATKTTGTDGSVPSVSDTTTGIDRTWLWIPASYNGGTIGTPTGFTERADINQGAGLAVADDPQPAAGTATPSGQSFVNATESVVWLGALLPVSAGGGAGPNPGQFFAMF